VSARSRQGAIRKVVFPVAGMGTRFLPVTKASPKEMLPIVDKPLIQYAAEEAAAAGATELVFITGRNKRSIEDHFDSAVELEMELERRGKDALLDQVRGILPGRVSCIYIRQAEPLGLGHAVLCARPVVGNEPFAVILADDLVYAESDGCMAQMAQVHEEHRASVLAVEAIAPADSRKYGVVGIEPMADRLGRVTAIVEKPAPEEAPSNLGVVGRYVLMPRIFDLLERTGRGAGGEIQLTDAIAALMSEEQVLALRFAGRRYDCGNKLDYLKATVSFARRHHEIGGEFREWLGRVAPDLADGER